MKTKFTVAALCVGLIAGVALAQSAPIRQRLTTWFESGLYVGSGALASANNKRTNERASGVTYVDMGSVDAGTCNIDPTAVAVTGARVGDSCTIGLPAVPLDSLDYGCMVTATNVVKIRACAPGANGAVIDPADAGYRFYTHSNQ